MTPLLRKGAGAPTQLISLQCREEPGKCPGCTDRWPSGCTDLSTPRCGGGKKDASPRAGQKEVGGKPHGSRLSGTAKRDRGGGSWSNKRSRSRAVRANEGSAAGFRGLPPDTGGLQRGGEGAAARRPIPAMLAPSGAVFGGRNGSCRAKKPAVW